MIHQTRRLGNYLNSAGTVLHHSSATIPIMMLLAAGVFPADRRALDPSLILVMHVNFWFYITIELALEFWFEWTVLSDLQHLYSLHWTLSFTMLGMLTAHRLVYLIAAGIELIISDSGADSVANNEEDGDKEELENNLDETEINIDESEKFLRRIRFEDFDSDDDSKQYSLVWESNSVARPCELVDGLEHQAQHQGIYIFIKRNQV